MFSFIVIAFLGGVLTIAAPCILAVLPIILGSTLGQQSKLRPLAIVLGLTVSFTGFGLLFHYVTSLFGISNNSLRNIALVFLIFFALALIFPAPYEKMLFYIKEFFAKIFPSKKPTTADLNKAPQKKGLLNGFIVGASLGLVWVPCAGPILGTILTLAVSETDISKVLVLLLSYSLGAGLPMLIIAYGGNFIVSKTKILKQKGELIQKISGGLLLVGVLLIMAGLDVKISAALGGLFPNLTNFEQSIVENNTPNGNESVINAAPTKTSDSQEKSESNNPTINLLPKGNLAPELTGVQNWINSNPLTLASLKGKVVLIDFWTYSCINCIRTLPYIKAWNQNYKDQGLVIIGVHAPEFAFEKELSNVTDAVKKFGIEYPVVQDNDFATWKAYKNHFWPAKYFIDKEGNIRFMHFGEGDYDLSEEVIRTLLAEGTDEKINTPMATKVEEKNGSSFNETPEIYFGFERGALYGSGETRALGKVQNFFPIKEHKNNMFYLEGEWQTNDDNVSLSKAPGKLIIKYTSTKINLVAGGNGKTIHAKILLNGKPIEKSKMGADVKEDGTVLIDSARLYNLVDSKENFEQNEVTIEFENPGVIAYTFTFG